MALELNPMRWPASWRDPALLELIKNSSINCLIVDSSKDSSSILERARQEGLTSIAGDSLPPGITVVQGEWPGVKLNDSGVVDRASTGPTGAPWVDSNGWAVRLARALNPKADVWVNASPRKPRLFPESYVVGVADAAVHGGRWIISLDVDLAAGIAARKAESVATWRKLTDAAGFFAARKEWSSFESEAVIGVISDFTGKNEFMSHELLNLLARTNQQHRIIPKERLSPSAFRGLKALLYTDEEAPADAARGHILEFVRAGGTLITGPKWGALSEARPAEQQHPRYSLHLLGKGLAAVAQPDFEDPYIVANDAVVLMSHRYELLRFWNVGAMGSYFTMGPDRKRGVVQLLFYASARFGNATAQVPYRCKAARLWTLDRAMPAAVEMEARGDGTEFHLPPVAQYAAIEIEL